MSFMLEEKSDGLEFPTLKREFLSQQVGFQGDGI